MGLAPGVLPGRTGLDAGRDWYEHHWGTALPADSGHDTLGMLRAAADGNLDVLFLVGADPIADCPDQELATRALEGARFVVAVDAFSSASTARADVVLPAAVYTERHGSFTNIEGRVTWLGQTVTGPGTSRPDWMIAAELASRLGGDLGATTLAELWAEIERVSPLHQGVSQALLVSRQARNGIVVPIGPGSAKEEASQAPAPLDPMADPGIASAQLHPLPPVPEWQASLGAVDGFTAPAGAPAVGPPPRLTPRAPTGTRAQRGQGLPARPLGAAKAKGR